VVVNTDSDRFEETIIAAPFDHDAPDLAQRLREKWRRLLPAQDARDFFENSLCGTASERRAILWQMIERRVSMAAQLRREPEPIKG
jgi:hypothetical protein